MRKNESINLILQHTRDTVYIKQIDDGPSSGTITFITDNVEKLLGRKAEDFLRNRDLWSSLLHPEDIKGIEEKVMTIFKSGEPARLTYRMLHKKNGHYRWVEDIITLQLDEHGRKIGLAGSLRDITEEKEVEDKLRDSEERFHVIFENASIGIYRSTPDGRVLLANPAMARILGFRSIDELAKYNLEEDGHYPAEFPRSKFRELIETNGSVAGLETKKTGKNGSNFWVRENAHVVRDQSGRIAYYEGTIEDITERKSAEVELEHERTLLRTLIENLPSSIFIKDKEHRKTVVNRQHLIHIVRDLNRPDLGSESAILGKTDFEIYPKEIAEEYFLDDQKVIRDGQMILDREELRDSPDGKRRWVSISKIPLHDKSGEVVGLLGIATDITDRKVAEEAVRASEAELRTLFASMKDVVIVVDKDGRYVRIAPTDPRLLYRPARELIGKTLHEVFSREQADEFLSIVHRALETGELQNVEYKLDIEGVETWFNASFSRIDGDTVLLVARDVTGPRRAEDALHESEETLKQITNSINDSIYSIDGQTAEFTYLSPAFERRFGYSLSDIKEMGGRWAFLKQVVQSKTAPELDPVVTDLQTQVVRETPVFEQWWRCKDGKQVYIEDKSVPTYDGDRLVRIDGVLRDITAWKLSEDAKQRERILLRTLIDNIPFPIYVKDTEARKIVANPADFRNMGCLSEAEVLGKTDYDFYPKEIADKFFADDQAVLREGRSVLNREEYFYHPNGKKRWLLTSKIPLLDENGKLVGLVGIGVDITEQKAIDEALRQSEAELRTLFESMKDVILVVDKDGRYLKASPTDDSQLYKPASEIIGKTNHEVFPEEQADFFLSVIHRTLETGQTQNVEYAINIRGEEKWRTATVSPLTNDSVLWVARDITDRKFMEKEITDSEKKYRELVENALVGVYRTTLSGKIIYANKAMADILEYDSQEELMYRTSFAWYKDIHEREVFTKELRNHGKTGKSMEVEFKTKTGRVKNVLISASLDGEIISGMAKDITEIRTLERQFLQTQKLEGLGNIAAGIAHDFNNILGVILGYADLLRQTAFDQNKFQRGTQAIMKSAERGRSLVRQLLTFARKTEITFGSVRVNDIVSEIEKLMIETFPKTIVVTTKLGSDLPVISGDSTQIHQVLLNICLNARDAMPKGGNLTISTDVMAHEILLSKFPEATARSYVEISIEDDGTGMDEETRRRIFEPFFTTKEIGKGTGLGLSVVYGIVQSHRGFVDVASKPKIGTTFDIYFPVYENSVEDIEVVEPPQEEIPGGTDTVLVIEDEEMLRDLLLSILESKGYNVLTARDGEEGVQTFRKHRDRVALVLSDLGLPKLSGEEIVSYIKQLNPSAKIVIASGFIDPDVKSGLESAGVKDFIQKPYRAHEVLKVVRAVINGHDA